MTEPLQIWAPNARTVSIALGGERVRMEPRGDGWWVGPVLEAGADYAICLDDDPPCPDPRSRWQPNGVHAASRAVDHQTLDSDRAGFVARPLCDAVIYELHVGTFSREGTFAAAIAHLDHLRALGVTHVELMPAAQFPGVFGWGYDGVDLFAAHAAYGGPSGLRDLVRACHRRQLAVVLDVVHNHVGPDGNYLDRFGPYHSNKHMTPWGPGINFDDQGAREVRRFFIDSALAWLEDYELDGLRLDAVHAIADTSRPHFIRQLCDEVDALEDRLGRELAIIAEYDDHDPTVVREQGWRCRAHWNDDFHHALHAQLCGERGGYYGDFTDPSALPYIFERGYWLDGRHSPFRRGPHGRPFGDLPRDRLVAYTQSHDQVGNRANGERLEHLVGPRKAKLAAALLMVSPFVPMLFQGEEWAASTPFLFFCDFTSPELRRAVRDGRAAEHGAPDAFDPCDAATRDASVLRWDERVKPEHAAMLAWYRALIAVRREHPELRDPSPASTRATRTGDVLRVERGPFALVANLADAPAREQLGDIVLASEPLASAGELPPLSCVLVHRG
ncbi:MAG TPA: malto-oligosyltrehalose trehalohydrolase [Kofleriaceae bacterium]|jgi:maltooligosyltrehalose trehalohydrolase